MGYSKLNSVRAVQPNPAELHPLVTISRATVVGSRHQERYAIQVARHTRSRDIFYGTSSIDGLGPSYIYHQLQDREGPVRKLQASHLDLIITGIIREGFRERIDSRLARDMNTILYQELHRKLQQYMVRV